MADVAWPANIRIGRTSVGLHALCADLNPNAAAMGGDLLDTSDVLFFVFPADCHHTCGLRYRACQEPCGSWARHCPTCQCARHT